MCVCACVCEGFCGRAGGRAGGGGAVCFAVGVLPWVFCRGCCAGGVLPGVFCVFFLRVFAAGVRRCGCIGHTTDTRHLAECTAFRRVDHGNTVQVKVEMTVRTAKT